MIDKRILNPGASQGIFARIRGFVFGNRGSLGVLTVLIGVILVAISPLFSIQSINVSAGKNTEKSVKVAADKYIGENFFLLGIGTIREEILSSSPYVKNATVIKSFPVGIDIAVEERIPAFVVTDVEIGLADLAKDNSGCALVGKDQTVLEKMTGEDCSALISEYSVPLLRVDGDSGYEVGDQVGVFTLDRYAKAVILLEDFGYTSVEILTGEGEDIFLTAENKAFVYDLSSDHEIQLRRSALVIGEIAAQRLEFTQLDLRFERPVIR